MQFFRKSSLWLIVLNILLALALLIMIIIVRGGLFEARGILAVKSKQRGVFQLAQNIIASGKLPQAEFSDIKMASNSFVDNAHSNDSSDNDDIGINISAQVSDSVSANMDQVYSDSNDDALTHYKVINPAQSVENQVFSLAIVGLGFDLELTEKVLQSVPAEVALGFGIINEQYLSLLSNLPNKVFVHVMVNDNTDAFNVSGVSSVLSDRENMNRIRKSINSYKRLDGIYLDMDSMINSGSSVLSSVLRVAKENDLSILNLNTATDLQIINKLAKSSLKFINSNYFMGYVKDDPMAFLENICLAKNDTKVLTVVATERNVDSLIKWINASKDQGIFLTDLSNNIDNK
ncbi:hypothetical protein CAXC1_150049 [Candidatus Xenohaliotis californiensis]|uniref:Divergent polysaccharide deacetylase n=1 Tax=Candidatus Xenohaliotis californiensis TaxID=84677 RepID=A0ABM9N789_9RICK|nr:hypothetical protein CAXC1_150049 [Candidatus Xenohaliotis californiensis]